MKRLFVIMALFIASAVTISAQVNREDCTSLPYENSNQVEPEAIVVRALSGKVKAKVGADVPANICLLVYSGKSLKLLRFGMVDTKGRFAFRKLTPGSYRLVARQPYPGYAIANIPIRIDPSAASTRKVGVVMVYRAIDSSSYGEPYE